MKVSAESNKPARGVIDTLSAGFENVNKIIWILLFPIAMDVFLWKGPQLSIAQFVKRLFAWYGAALSAQLNQAGAAATSDLFAEMDQMKQAIEASLSQFNLFSILVGGGPIGGMLPAIPTLNLVASSGPIVEVVSTLAIFGLFVLLGLAGLFLGCIYLGLVAQQVRDGKVDFARLMRRVWRYWLSVLGFVAMVIGFAFVTGVPTGLLISGAFMASPSVGMVLSTLVAVAMQMAAMLMIMYLFFLADAIIISEVGPFRALLNSVRVVVRNFWSALALIGLIILISLGTQEIWRYLSAESWGAIAGIAGNAYIASGLTAARMLYYRDRYAMLEGAVAPVSGGGREQEEVR